MPISPCPTGEVDNSGFRFWNSFWFRSRPAGSFVICSLTAAVQALLCCAICAQSAYVNFEGKQTSPLRLSPDGSRLFAVNTPDARLSVFDVSQPSNPRLIAEIPVGVEPVSVNPRDNEEAWVVNEVSDSISIVSVSQRIVTDTIYVQDEPADVVFAGSRALVSAARKNLIAVFATATHSLVTNITLFGENPTSPSPCREIIRRSFPPLTRHRSKPIARPR